MYPRTNYEMTEADLADLLESMKPVPMIIIWGMAPSSQQENANAAWARLGARMGFDPMTVQPNGKGDRFFSAIPSETPEHKAARLEQEAETARQNRIAELQASIQKQVQELASLVR